MMVFGRFLLLVFCCCSVGQTAWAQREYYNWYFGNRAGITFNTFLPTGLADGQQDFVFGAGCISDSTGQFLLASDGKYIWNSQWQRLPGFVSPRTPVNFTNRQIFIVRQPGPRRRYYVFRTSNEFTGAQLPPSRASSLSMPFAVVAVGGRNGLGTVVANDSIRLPNWTINIHSPYLYLNTNWVAIRHANGQDLWITAQTDEGRYISCLLTASGLGPPVVSLAPRNISVPSLGILKASTDGKTLAATIYTVDGIALRSALTEIEIARFDPATGRVTASSTLPNPFQGIVRQTGGDAGAIHFNFVAGLEFSPDGSRLYADTTNSNGVFQYNLLAGTPASIAASRTTVLPQIQGGRGYSESGDLQLGPDGNVYVIRPSYLGVGRIEHANAQAPFCQFVADGVRFLSGGASRFHTFPNTTNDLNLPPVVITAGGSVTGRHGCPGELIPFVSSLSPFVSAAAFAWNFGDPASGPLNTDAGQAPAHRFEQAGTYAVELRITAADGRQFTSRLTVVIAQVPIVDLGTDSVFCAGTSRLLDTGPQPAGSAFRWQDGSTSPTYLVTQSGYYGVSVTNAAGCITHKKQQLIAQDCPDLPNIITPNGDPLNQTFVLRGLHAPDWAIRLYSRWGREVFQQTSYDNTWAAAGQANGLYYYLLTNAKTGQQYKGWVEVLR